MLVVHELFCVCGVRLAFIRDRKQRGMHSTILPMHS